jgi:hypothetical protein
MPAVRYVVPGATSGAFVPVPASTTAVVRFKQEVTGQPGTQAIPAGLADFPGGQVVNGLPVRGAGSGYNQGSNTMPPVWYPQLYYERGLSETPEVSIYSDNQLPVPAMDPRGVAARMARPPQFLGQAQVTQSKAMPKWSNWLPWTRGAAAGSSSAAGWAGV